MRRLRYRHELTEIELYDAVAPAELGSVFTPPVRVSGVLALLGHAVLGVVKVAVFTLGLTARIAVPIVGELVCLVLATVGMLGRGLDCVGGAAARRSWVIAAGRDALAHLPPMRRVERRNRTAIAVRRVR